MGIKELRAEYGGRADEALHRAIRDYAAGTPLMELKQLVNNLRHRIRTGGQIRDFDKLLDTMATHINAGLCELEGIVREDYNIPPKDAPK